MKRAEMRIVGLSYMIIIQRKVRNEWEQTTMDNEQFEKMMKSEYPEYWNEYERAETNKSAEEWFYHYGETSQMIRKGEAYIFR